MILSSSSLQDFFHNCETNGLPVAIYRLPRGKSVKVVAQTTGKLEELSLSKTTFPSKDEKGFVFAPFASNSKLKAVFIQPDIYCTEKKLPKTGFASSILRTYKPTANHSPKVSSRKEFESLVNKIKKRIINQEFRKVVAARVSEKKLPENFEAVIFFKALCAEYPSAFVSLVYTHEYGTWIGATPEVLLQVKSNTGKTFSLAGTKATASKKWGAKEYEEQQFVSDYIAQILSAKGKNHLLVKGPQTIQAGNLFHLLTTFVVKNFDAQQWKKIVHKLHPTPAVAGLPKNKAVRFVVENEKSNRNFYSGYLGPVNLDKQINLFVNIRCMQLHEEHCAVYTGCGITADSNPISEWRETEAKAETLLRVLRKI